MFIRIRAVFVIFLTTLVIISFSVLVGITTMRSGIETSQEADLMLLSDVAERFISSDIKSLKIKAAEAAGLLAVYEDTEWRDVLSYLESRYTDFTGIAVFDNEYNLIVSAGDMPSSSEIMDIASVNDTFSGKTALSATIPSQHGGVAFYLSAPLKKADDITDKILVFALPGTYFSELVSDFSIWDTGHIFMDDNSGRLISNVRSEWVAERLDFIDIAEIEPYYEKTVHEMRQSAAMSNDNNAEIIRYSIHGVPRLCAYRHISGSEEGWLLGVVAPLPESPFKYIEQGLIAVGFVSLFLSLIAAAAASGFIKKPFDKIAALKEEAVLNSEFKSEFLANMSHEIRTPMSAILGIIEIILHDKTIKKDIHDSIYKIYSSGDLLLNLINDILDLSKIESGKFELAASNYETASLINDTVSLNMMRIGSKEIKFKLSVDDNLPQVLHGDEIRIKQILNNLLSNAFKYTEKGGVKLCFKSEEIPEKSEECMLIISVSDTGQGMTKEQINNIFEQYSRFNYKTNRTVEGTGLGMNITQNLVSLMEGSLSLKSEPGKGSVFTVKLPQKIIGEGKLGSFLTSRLESFNLEDVQKARKADIIYEPMPHGRVLVVDDVESNLFVAGGLMAPYELSVETASSGFEAVGKIKDGNVYDIVFMDHMMPEMDGIEAVKIIRDYGYTGCIVALTANTVIGHKEMFLAGGFDDFISKPIDTHRLNAVLKKYIRDK
ncbi:MAG: ATP-binding protein [Oscillospiraceae bacterium]|nr:ATP-binding protein [Oscillospiraceae bacterium]